MAGPAPFGFFVYAVHVERVAAFYESVLQLQRRHATTERVILGDGAFQMIVHELPDASVARIARDSPVRMRGDAAYKFFYTVESLDTAAQTAATLGGEVLSQQWTGPGFVVRNAVDPEGNIFHLRERLGEHSA